MKKITKNLLIILTIVFIAIIFVYYSNSHHNNRNHHNLNNHHSKQETQTPHDNIFNENKKIAINENYSFVFKFVTKPKIEEVIVKVEVLDNQGNKVNNLDVFGSYDMPSMRGHHASGNRPFMLNKQGNYLLPVHIAMGGGWEIVLSIKENDSELYQGKILFDI